MEQNKGLKKKYASPLIFDIGGPRINVVGASVKGCAAGSGGTATCSAGATGATTMCETGARVSTSCGTGGTVGQNQTCSIGSTAAKKCTNGTAAGTCSSGGSWGL